MADDLVELVEQMCDSRAGCWEDARQQVASWLDRECASLLAGLDEHRLRVDRGRVKRPDRIIDKIRRLRTDDDHELDTAAKVESAIRDIVGLKVLCKSTRDQLLLSGHLRSIGGFALIEERDYLAAPKPSGYRAVHFIYRVDVTGADPVVVEVQVKTRLQDAWSELTHEDLYKPGAAMNPGPFHKSVARTMANLLAEVDRLADDLADEIAGSIDVDQPAIDNPSDSPATAEDAIDVAVRTSGARYALAVDGDGRQGLIPAYRVRELAAAEGRAQSDDWIRVDTFIHPGDELSVIVEATEQGTYFLPEALPSTT